MPERCLNICCYLDTLWGLMFYCTWKLSWTAFSKTPIQVRVCSSGANRQAADPHPCLMALGISTLEHLYVSTSVTFTQVKPLLTQCAFRNAFEQLGTPDTGSYCRQIPIVALQTGISPLCSWLLQPLQSNQGGYILTWQTLKAPFQQADLIPEISEGEHRKCSWIEENNRMFLYVWWISVSLD